MRLGVVWLFCQRKAPKNQIRSRLIGPPNEKSAWLIARVAGVPTPPVLSLFQANGWYVHPADPLYWLPPLLLIMFRTRPYPIGEAASTPPVLIWMSATASVLRAVRLMFESL